MFLIFLHEPFWLYDIPFKNQKGHDMPRKAPLPPASSALVAHRKRHDGWSAARVARFLETLAETGCVRDAARVAGTKPLQVQLALRIEPGLSLFEALVFHDCGLCCGWAEAGSNAKR